MVAAESYGRLGPNAESSLSQLATHTGTRLSDPYAAPRLLPRWRAALQRAIVWSTADVDLLALGSTACSSSCRLAGWQPPPPPAP